MALAPSLVTAALQILARYRPNMLLHMTILTSFLFSNMVLAQDMVEYLPGFPGKLPFKLETGYVGLGENEEVQLFYYFFESERDPENDPVLLWLTGGPGCSGVTTFLYRNGPLNVDLDNYEDGSIPPLILNEYSFTKRANIIYLDQPVGTGFSYTTTTEASYSNDTLSAKFTYEFIERYLKNPLYICGDSYSGIWVPHVVKEVYDGIEAGTEPVMNMKGYILGSPHSDSFLDLNGRIPYANRMGLLSDELYQSAKVHCQGNFVDVDQKNVLCQNVIESVNECVKTVCRANILEPICKWGPTHENVSSWHMSSQENFLRSVVPTKRFTCRMKSYSTCHTWANDKSVQKALHIREGTIGEWERCNNTIEFNLVGPSGNIAYINDIQSAIPYHQNLTNKRCRAFIYSGDHDMVVPHTVTKRWIDSLKLSIKSNWRPWFVEDQVAGYTLTYAKKDYELTFATVKGAGHVPPEYKKPECFDMFSRWLDQSPL